MLAVQHGSMCICKQEKHLTEEGVPLGRAYGEPQLPNKFWGARSSENADRGRHFFRGGAAAGRNTVEIPEEDGGRALRSRRVRPE